MVQKRNFLEQHDDGLGIPSHKPKRIHTFQTISRVDTRDILGAIEPVIRKVVRDVAENVVSKIFPSSSSTSANEAGTSAGCSLQLVFTNKLPKRIFTNNILKAEGGSPLKVMLCHANSKIVVDTGPLSSARIDIFVLSGLFATDQVEWSEDDFNSKILREREGKRPLLAGSQSILLKNGVGIIHDLSITDNSSWTSSKKFILGAKLSPKHPDQQRVREAKSHPFSVMDNRGEGYRKYYPPSSQDEVWRLEKIRKDGKFHERLAAHGIFTVGDFLHHHKLDPRKLRHILGLSGMCEKMWRKLVDHAKTCIMHDPMGFKHSNGCHGELVENQNQPANLNTFHGQPSAEQAGSYQQLDPYVASTSGFQQLEPITHQQEHLRMQPPMTNTNINDEDGMHALLQTPNYQTDAPFGFTLETNFATENGTFQHQTPWQFHASATFEQGNNLPLPPPGYAAEVADFGMHSSHLDHGIF